MTGKKNPYDKTSTKRQSAHLDRLAANKGQRTVIDLDGERIEQLQALIEAGYGSSKADVIRRAIHDAHTRLLGSLASPSSSSSSDDT